MIGMVIELMFVVIGTGCAIMTVYKVATRPDEDGIQWDMTRYKNY